MKHKTVTKYLTVVLLSTTSFALGQHKRPVLPIDCVTVRYAVDDAYHHAIEINPQGTYAAYLVKSPNLEMNRNEFELYVKPLADAASSQERLILSSPRISQLQWLNDGRHLVALVDVDGRTVVMEIDTRKGSRELLLKEPVDITEYSINGSGSVLVAAIAKESGILPDAMPNALEIARGYRIPFQQPDSNGLPKRALLVTRRVHGGGWTTPLPVTLHSPFTGRELPALLCQEFLNLSLSPDGRLLVVSYVETERMPDRWRESPFVEQVRADGFPGIHVTALYNLQTGKTTLPIQTPWAYSTPMWSSDSVSFLIAARSPVSSSWEREDFREQTGSPHLFCVDVEAGSIEEVAKQLVYPVEAPLAWDRNTGIAVQTARHEVSKFIFRAGKWVYSSSFHIPIPGLLREVSSDGTDVIGEVEAPTDPPELFLYRAGEAHAAVFSKLDPQFGHLSLAPVEQVQWKTSTGYPVHGFLFLPPDYVAGKRYPLVIQTKPSIGQFACDSGQDHYPSFAPQPLANAGILYLIQDGSESISDEIANAPKGYPGGIGEAAFQMDMWDSAVNKLASWGIVDPTRVGIIGFSRSGWYTEFIVSHSAVRYRAATIADNVNYSMGEYWLLHTPGVIRGWDAMYGGPPYGKTLESWLKYSISFTVDKIRTPLLMEEMGYGVPFKDKGALPLDLAYSFELFTGLSRLGKPVELYYYPTEDHQPDHPLARLASLQRNLDWYRFWLQGFQAP
ncbi:MAG: hypothetical protein WA634_06505, partial [Silvibacterium sp.]